MTMPHTLTLREAETRLRELVEQAQVTHRPIILTAEETTQPVAVLMEVDRYAITSGNPSLILTTRLRKLGELLDLLKNHWDVNAIRQAFPQTWCWHLEGVWEASQHREPPFRQLVMLLQMAGDDLDMTQFTEADVLLWRECLDVLKQPVVTPGDLAHCDEALIEHDFPVLLNLDEDTVALYVAES